MCVLSTCGLSVFCFYFADNSTTATQTLQEGYIRIEPGAFELVPVSLPTIDFTLSRGWCMSRHTYQTHCSQLGHTKKPNPHVSVFSLQKSAVGAHAKGTGTSAADSDAFPFSTGITDTSSVLDSFPVSPAHSPHRGGHPAERPARQASAVGGDDRYRSKWNFGKMLGDIGGGAYGSVQLCVKGSAVCACKKLHNGKHYEKYMKDMVKEFELIKGLKSPHCIQVQSLRVCRCVCLPCTACCVLCRFGCLYSLSLSHTHSSCGCCVQCT